MIDYNKELLKINQLISSKNYENALKKINSLQDYELNNFLLSEVLYRKGICLFNLREFEDALECFNESWKIDDYFINHKIYDKAYFEVYNENIKHAYFLILAKNNNVPDSNFSYLKKVLVLNPDKIDHILKITDLNVKYFNKICKDFFYRKNYKIALKFAEIALKIDKNSIDPLIYKAILFHINSPKIDNLNKINDDIYELYYKFLNNDSVQDNDYEKLIETLSKPTKTIDNSLVIKGLMLNSLGEFEKARKIFHQCLQSHTYYDLILIGKIQLLNSQKKYYQSLYYFNNLKKFDYDSYFKRFRKIFSKDKDAVKIIEKCLIDFDNIDNRLLNALNYSYNLDFENAIKEYDKLENNNNLKAELLFALHRYDEAVKSISEESDAHIKFMNYCKDKENTGFFGVFKSSLSNFNWEYAYVESGNFKRIMANTLEELNYKIDVKHLIWKKIDDDLADKTITENHMIKIKDAELIFGFSENYGEIIPFDLELDDAQMNGYLSCLYDEYMEAIMEFNKITDINPIILNNKGYAYLKLKKYDEALKCFDEGLKMDPNDSYLLFNKSFVYLNQKDYQKACETFKKCRLKFDEDFEKELSEYLYDLGWSLYENSQYEDSIHCYDMCLHINERNPNFWNCKGISFAALKDYGNALKNYDEALSRVSNDAIFLFNKASCLFNMNEFEQSLIFINESISSGYRNADAWNLKGRIYKELSDFDEALKCYKKAFELYENKTSINSIDNHLEIIYLLMDCEKYNEALEYCDELLKLGCEDLEGLYCKGMCYRYLKDFENAEKISKEIMKYNESEGYFSLFLTLREKFYFLENNEEIIKNNEKILECLNVLIQHEFGEHVFIDKADILGYLGRFDELLETLAELLKKDDALSKNEWLITESIFILNNVLEVDYENKKALALKSKFERKYGDL